MELPPTQKAHPVHVTLIVAIIAVVAGAGYLGWRMMQSSPRTNPPPSQTLVPGLQRFTSAEDVQNYLALARRVQSSGFFSGSIARSTTAIADDVGLGLDLGLGQAEVGSTPSIPKPDRFSTTNVQVTGIDEPDIVKTDGQHLFISSDQPYAYERLIDPGSVAPDISPVKATTSLVDALPVDAIKKLGIVDQTGPLLVSQDRLMVFSADGLYGFDVSNPATPKQAWKDTYGESSSFVTARLMDNKVYLVTQKYFSGGSPCPLEMMKVEDRAVTVPCTELYHPRTAIPVNTTYSIMRIDPVSGQVEDSVSVLADSGSSVISVFPENLYLAYTMSPDPTTLWFDFYSSAARDLFPPARRAHLDTLQGYGISTAAKMTEISLLLDEHISSLGEKEQAAFEKTMEERMKRYTEAHRRDFEQTGLVRVDLATLDPVATGQVPGGLLNQFALDEFANHLRVATTTNSWFFGSNESVNDVYVLDANLKQVGSVLDLGKGEQIYSVRFLGDRGYVVTFRQIDPFYVLDLSNPRAPIKTGELKIPGYSSYLHPLDATTILGIGQDGAVVKASLFDVSDPAAPKEQATMNLASGWTDIQYNHHAFLQDAKHSVFFVPANQQGFIVSYANKVLSVVKTITDLEARRAVYINDNLYVIGTNRLVVLQESDWAQVAELTL